MRLKRLLARHRWRFALTLLLILSEAAILVLVPLFMGKTIDGVLTDRYEACIPLAVLGVCLLVVGMARRVFDSRFYAKVYEQIGVDTLVRFRGRETSVKTARLQMVRELVEFLENTLPELINNSIGLIGIVGVLFVLNLKIFYGSLAVAGIVMLMYWVTSKRTLLYNEQANNELERQVDIVSMNQKKALREHLRRMMHWNLKLSDLEAINFSFSWLVALSFLILSIVMATADGVLQYGALFALVMYVFQYIDALINLPYFYQSWLRLHEIALRLE